MQDDRQLLSNCVVPSDQTEQHNLNDILNLQEINCPVCGKEKCSFPFIKKCNQNLTREYVYYKCESCESIFIQPDVINNMDNGINLIEYKDDYWEEEYNSAIERCYGAGLARVAETIYYAKIPIHNFLDIGSGTGKLLDALAKYLPSKQEHFYAVEKFPPKVESRTNQKNYYTDGYNSPSVKFDAGVCIEVLEHLTPKMISGLLFEIAAVSNEKAVYLFNTGLTEYTQLEDINYIDPFVRGHIVSYSIKGLKGIFERSGFKIFPIKGKTWAFVAEYQSDSYESEDITERMWKALPENLELLCDPEMGSIMKILGLESVRAYI